MSISKRGDLWSPVANSAPRTTRPAACRCFRPFDPSYRIITIDSAKTAIGHACRELKLPAFTHHCMRHYFVSNAVEAGVDFKTIAAWVGHKDGGLLAAKTYGHLRDTHSFEMAKRMTFAA